MNAEIEALREILRRAREIIAGERLVGGPRAVAFDLGSVAARFLREELREELNGPAPAAQATWEPQPNTKGRGK
jgi:hypothetical protein